MAWWILVATSAAATLQVGPGRTWVVPSEAAAVAEDGDVVEIDAGTYDGDVATWTAHGLTLRGVGGLAHLRAEGESAGGKAIWVIAGDDTTVEWIEFSGAAVRDRNGAGIRQEGADLTVRNCSFHDNENGILAGDNIESEILVEFSEFARNGAGDGFSHNLYINHVWRFTLRGNYLHHAVIGHQVKSRADENALLYNRFGDEEDGKSSYTINLPNGGDNWIVGNLIQQGALAENGTVISVAEEGAINPSQHLVVAHNTLVNERGSGTFLRNAADPPALVQNNLFVGSSTELLDGSGTLTGNLVEDGESLVDRAAFDYSLQPDSAPIDAGEAVESGADPTEHYVHPAGTEPRPEQGPPDVGAYEWVGDTGGATTTPGTSTTGTTTTGTPGDPGTSGTSSTTPAGTDPDGTLDDTGGEGTKEGCGCASGDLSVTGWTWALGGLLARRRFRRPSVR
jgi:hypothetical protein